MKTKFTLWALALGLIAGLAVAQEYNGVTGFVPAVNTQCYVLKTGKRYAVQATVLTQDYTSASYLYSSVNVFNSSRQLTYVDGPAPVGYVVDGGPAYFERKTPIVLKDTDIYQFTALRPADALCYTAGITADGGVSSMALTFHEVIR